jgi:hypothetical protein
MYSPEDDCGAEPSPQIGEIAKNQKTESRGSDQLDIAERCDSRGRAVLKRPDDQVVTGAAKQAETGEQQQID